MWSSRDFSTLFVWRPDANQVARYTLDEFDPHAFQFMQVTGHYMGWFASQSSSVMDLDSGIMYDLGITTNVVAGGGRIGTSQSERLASAERGKSGPARISVQPGAAWFSELACGARPTPV